VGGSIPGETKGASIAIYEAVEMMNYNRGIDRAEFHSHQLRLFAVSE
jgi:ABC-type molybdate transport system permease subunit